MPRWKVAVIAACVMGLFLVANRGAYKGFFQDDDLDNLAWAPQLGTIDYLQGLVTPVFSRNNFRPVGHYYYHVLENFAGLRFVPYVAVLQLIHVVNGLLLWLLLRRLKIASGPALLGAVFFLFHPSTFDAYWRPMYVFDVLCGTFCLLSFVAFIDRRWVASFACFFLAYKAKELAVMLPAVFAVYEYLLGEKKWKPLVPFFLVSLLFGIQALISNVRTHDAYTLSVSASSVWSSLRFYIPQFFLLSVAFVAILAWGIFRERLALLGQLTALLLLVPLLVLPSRAFSVYLYVPLIGASIALAACFRQRIWAPLVCAGLWVGLTFGQMREYRRATLAVADENHSYVEKLARFTQASPRTMVFVADGAPAAMHPWGIDGALRYLTKRSTVSFAGIETAEGKRMLQERHLAVLSWNEAARTLQISRRDPDTPDAAYISMRQGMPPWQLGQGWYQGEGSFRWAETRATAKLGRPQGANQFEVAVNISPIHLGAVHKLRLELWLDEVPVGAQEFVSSGWQIRRYALKPAPEGEVNVEFRSSPEFFPLEDPRKLGVAIGAFGFVKQDQDSGTALAP